MGHKNNNLVNEVLEQLKNMRAFGQSKHEAKIEGTFHKYIYSYQTFECYKKVCVGFAKHCKSNYKCKNIEQARQYVDTYLKSLIDRNLSPHTIKMYSAAIGKLYQEPTTNFIQTPSRERQNIVRSRYACVRDAHFSEKRNYELVETLKSSGLRRSEVENIRGDCLSYDEKGQAYIFVNNGKGGRERYVPILNNNPIVINKILSTPTNQRVFPKVSNACDVHSYRAYYANQYYNMLCKDIDTLERKDLYYARKELRGVIYQKEALLKVSYALGHSRYSIVASNYLWNK